MKYCAILTALVGTWVMGPLPCPAESNAPVSTQPVLNQAAAPVTATPATSPEEKDKVSLEKRIKPILDALKLNDTAKEAKVREVLSVYFPASKAWHQSNDAQLKELWKQFDKARADHDQAGADGVMSQIDAVYATFKPQHDKLLTGLATVLTPEQIETVEDVLTVNKVKVTFNAYGEIFHGLTDAQKAFILKNLKAAREEAIDAGSMTEKSAFFKKYKIKIEAYLTAQGYDVKQSYSEFIAKQKAEAEAKKAAAQSATNPANNLPEKQ
jgi:hypothetical protein